MHICVLRAAMLKLDLYMMHTKWFATVLLQCGEIVEEHSSLRQGDSQSAREEPTGSLS